MSGPRISQTNGNARRPPNISRVNSAERSERPERPLDRPVHVQHDDLIKYIHDSWSKVEMERGSSTKYYQEEKVNLKDFKPFDLEGYWGRRKHQSTLKQQHS